MKIPSQLAKGLSEKQIEQLERELKSSLLAKQLRSNLNDKIESIQLYEEDLEIGIEKLASLLGKRRGYREVLNLLPEA